MDGVGVKPPVGSALIDRESGLHVGGGRDQAKPIVSRPAYRCSHGGTSGGNGDREIACSRHHSLGIVVQNRRVAAGATAVCSVLTGPNTAVPS